MSEQKDNAEPSGASAGSQRDTPLFSERRKMADAAFEWCRKNNASDRAIENIVAALFSLGLVVKRPTLTDAEREAITWAINKTAQVYDDPEGGPIKREAMRGLLQRTK